MTPSRFSRLLLASLVVLLVQVPVARGAAPEDGPLDPRLSRRIAVEDQPLLLQVSLPEGMPVTDAPDGPRVGSPGLRYRYRWRLLDVDGEALRERTAESRRTSDRWETAAFVEPYRASFPGRLLVEVEVEYLVDGAVRGQGRTRFPITRIQDVTPPFERSLGDEEQYPDFLCRSLTVPDGGQVTTTDGLRTAEGDRLTRSPFRAITDDGAVREGDDGPEEGWGTLEFSWKNVFDNLNPPFTGADRRVIRRFGLYLRPHWDLLGSHPLVSDPESTYLASKRVVFRTRDDGGVLHLVDLTDALPEPPEEPGPFGEGRVRLPLPYDRVGDLEVGFYAEDTAWPSPNVALAGGFRFRVVDDIRPVQVLSVRKTRGGRERWVTADAVNRRWTDSEHTFGLPEAFGGPPMEELAALGLKVRTPYEFHLMAFDNTRLAREGTAVELAGPPGAPGYGIRVPGRGGRHLSWDVPVDGFDPSLVRTNPSRPPAIYFSVPGDYTLTLRTRDVHGNERVFPVRLKAGDREFVRIQVSEGSQRRRAP